MKDDNIKQETMKPGNFQGSLTNQDLKEKMEQMSQKNKLTKYLDQKPEGYPCFMWWPKLKILTPVKLLCFCKENAKFLQVEYYKPKSKVEKEKDNIKSKMLNYMHKQMSRSKMASTNTLNEFENDIIEEIKFYSETVTEYYNLMELRMESLKSDKIDGRRAGEGISANERSSEYLIHNLVC